MSTQLQGAVVTRRSHAELPTDDLPRDRVRMFRAGCPWVSVFAGRYLVSDSFPIWRVFLPCFNGSSSHPSAVLRSYASSALSR